MTQLRPLVSYLYMSAGMRSCERNVTRRAHKSCFSTVFPSAHTAHDYVSKPPARKQYMRSSFCNELAPRYGPTHQDRSFHANGQARISQEIRAKLSSPSIPLGDCPAASLELQRALQGFQIGPRLRIRITAHCHWFTTTGPATKKCVSAYMGTVELVRGGGPENFVRGGVKLSGLRGGRRWGGKTFFFAFYAVFMPLFFAKWKIFRKKCKKKKFPHFFGKNRGFSEILA